MGVSKFLKGSFGSVDRVFAGHPSDAARAFKWLAHLRKKGIGWKEAQKQIEKHLEGSPKAHVKKQVARAKKLIEPWISD